MKISRYLLGFCFLLFFTGHRLWASDINDIVYPPPEPERMGSEDKDKTDAGNAEDLETKVKRPGITEETIDQNKMDKIYVYPDGSVQIPGTTSFEPVDAEKKRRKNSGDDSGEYHNHYQQYRHDHHHAKPDYQIEPVLSEKKGRVKSKLGITGPGYVIVPAKESNGIGR